MIKVDAGPPAAPAEKPDKADAPAPTNGKASKAAYPAANGSLPKGVAPGMCMILSQGTVILLAEQSADCAARAPAAAPAKAEPAVEPAAPPLPEPSSGADAALAALRCEMAAAKEAAAAEIALMRRQLASAQAATSEAEKAGRPCRRTCWTAVHAVEADKNLMQ